MTATPGERITSGWVPSDDTLGARLAMIRHRKGWGGANRAGEMTDVRPETWRAWENGTNQNPRNFEEIVAKIARRAGCDAGWLYGGRKLEGAIDLDRLEDGLRRGLAGPVALALALNRDIDPAVLARKNTEEYPSLASQSSPSRTNKSPSTPPRPTGRPQTGQKSLTGPKPVRPTRLRYGPPR